MTSTVIFAGAGPGAPDLVTLRCLRALENADLVVYAGSLVNPEILDYCRHDCRKADSSKLSLDEVVGMLSEAAKAGLKAVRLHTGDPAMYGAIGEQMDALDILGIPYEVIPGVSSVFAAAAALRAELTRPGVSQSVILTRTAGRTPMPESETIENFLRTGATMVFFLSAGGIDSLVSKLLEAGCAPATPSAAVYRASWPDQAVVRASLVDLPDQARSASILRQALIIVGKALAGGGKSLLYDHNFSHGYRNRISDESFDGRCAFYAMSRRGAAKALQIAQAFPGSRVFIPERLADATPGAETFLPKGLSILLKTAWRQFDAHVFFCAAGIAVRKIAPLIDGKTQDPAVVVCGDDAAKIISLCSGHIGGANRLARKIARVAGGEAVVTTSTDIEGLLAFDEFAARMGWWIENPEDIKTFNSALLEKTLIDIRLPPELVKTHFPDVPADPASPMIVVLDPPEDDTLNPGTRRLILRSARYILGFGCMRGATAEEIDAAFQDFLARCRVPRRAIAGIATCDVKHSEPGLLEFAAQTRLDIQFFPASELDKVLVPTPSDSVRRKIGSASVSEAAASLAANAPVAFPKVKYGNLTMALAKIKVNATSFPSCDGDQI